MPKLPLQLLLSIVELLRRWLFWDGWCIGVMYPRLGVWCGVFFVFLEGGRGVAERFFFIIIAAREIAPLRAISYPIHFRSSPLKHLMGMMFEKVRSGKHLIWPMVGKAVVQSTKLPQVLQSCLYEPSLNSVKLDISIWSVPLCPSKELCAIPNSES